jgi:hypothetical protein
MLRSDLDEAELQTVAWLFRAQGIDVALAASYY